MVKKNIKKKNKIYISDKINSENEPETPEILKTFRYNKARQREKDVCSKC